MHFYVRVLSPRIKVPSISCSWFGDIASDVSSEDVCQSTTKVDGIRKLRVTLAAKYFDRYNLCVIPPDGSRTCKTFEIHKQGDAYGDAVGWRKHFPDEGNGGYTVVWKMTNGDRFGEKLGFHR